MSPFPRRSLRTFRALAIPEGKGFRSSKAGSGSKMLLSDNAKTTDFFMIKPACSFSQELFLNPARGSESPRFSDRHLRMIFLHFTGDRVLYFAQGGLRKRKRPPLPESILNFLLIHRTNVDHDFVNKTIHEITFIVARHV